MIKQPIFPYFGRGQLLTPTASSQNTSVQSGPKQLCLTNIGTQTVYVRVDDSASTAAASNADYPVLANSQQVISYGTGTKLSYIAPGGAGSTLHVMECEGY